jgi:hypothetical protein
MRTLPGAASTAVRDLLTAPPVAARVVGVHPSCMYVVTGDELVALESADALGLPCSVRLGVDRSAAPFAGVRLGDTALVGGGTVIAGRLTVTVGRWWAPRQPRRPLRSHDDARTPSRADVLTELLAGRPCPVPADRPVDELLGLGPGLTPAGDDVLAGLLIALRHHDAPGRPIADEVTRLAHARTTTLSAALLRHAAAGLALPAVVDVADALAGHGTDAELSRAVTRLLAVGHSSGTALAHGLLRGARTVQRTVEEVA